MREDPSRLSFEVGAVDGQARTGVIQTGHGPVETPAFVPLATSGTVRGLSSAEVADLGYGMVLGNTYHLLVSPGPDRIREAGGLHSFMGWDGAIITDSGGFQVFSLAHGGVSDEIKGTGRRSGGPAETVSIEEQGVTFRSYRDGSLLELSPETSMEVQAALGSDIALAFDECTPVSADRDYTASSTERTHRWLDRCLAWHEANGPPGQAVYGIVQGGVYDDLREESVEYVTSSAVDGIAIGGTLGRDKEEMHGVLSVTMPLLPAAAPRHLLGIGEVDDLVRGIGLGVDTFDCAVPTRLARHGMALAPVPDARYRIDLRKSRMTGDTGPLVEGCDCPACTAHTRDYLSYLSRAEELTAVRLLVLHNLHYLESVTSSARRAITDGRYGEFARAVIEGSVPWDA